MRKGGYHKKLTTEEFIEKARKVHGNVYDYSKVVYEKSDKKVVIICLEHGEFPQAPHNHLQGTGCPFCAIRTTALKKKLTTEGFIEKARKVHGNRYDYSLTDYKNNRKRVKIICSKHGVFEQRAGAHLRGSGCPDCGRKRTLSQQESLIEKSRTRFIEKSRDKFGNKFILVSNYVRSADDVQLQCMECGTVFTITPHRHLQSVYGGCPKCIEKQRRIYRPNDYNLQNILDKRFGKDVIKIDQTSLLSNFSEPQSLKSLKVTCCFSDCGHVEDISVATILCSNKTRPIICKQCKKLNRQRKQQERVLQKRNSNIQKYRQELLRLHGNRYSYNFDGYKNTNSYIQVHCTECGCNFSARISSLLYKERPYGRHCPKCNSEKRIQRNIEMNTLTIDEIKNRIESRCGENAFNLENLRVERVGKYRYVYIKSLKDDFEFRCNLNSLLQGTGGDPREMGSFGEQRIASILTRFNISYIRQKRFKDLFNKLRNRKVCYRFDFYIPELNILIEFHGGQHYTYNKFFHNNNHSEYIESFQADQKKAFYAYLHNIKLVEIPYWDFDRIEEILIEEVLND